MKRLKRWGLTRLGGKRGFTLIELLIVMVILAILAGVVIMAVGGVFGTAHESAYESVKPQLQNGVIEYATSHNGNLPPTIGNATIIDIALGGNVTAEVLDLCALVTSGGILRTLPDGCHDAAGDDNCNNASCEGCLDTNHYIWYIDDTGNVYSACPTCPNPLTDGYQGVWP
ncbi:MAG: type II secretion system protein [Dehalococcoidia bacterium]|nr:type II secretion system protein [Dehalococcoidia bacterium]